MTFVYEEGTEIDLGSHGEHDFTYVEGEPVPDTGLSDLVFEEGVGLGGGAFQFEFNGNGLRTFDPIETTQTHEEFYDYRNAQAQHGYEEYEVTTVFVHHDTVNDTYALVLTHNDGTGPDNQEYSIRTDFSEGYGGPDGQYFILGDDQVSSQDEYNDTWIGSGWGASNTDGFVIDVEAWEDVTLTWDPDYIHPNFGNPSNELTDVRVITSDGDPPDGGGAEYASMPDSSLRIVIDHSVL